MRIIKNNDDVVLLYKAGVISDEFRDHLTRYFERLQADLDELEPNRYSVEDCGYVVILEAGDNLDSSAAAQTWPMDDRLISRMIDTNRGKISDGEQNHPFPRMDKYRLLT